MKQHYFIGIKVPDSLVEQAVIFQEKYALNENYKVLPEPADYHITLRYLGEIAEEHYENVVQTLKHIGEQHADFTLSMNGLNYFGSESGPRVVYLQVAEEKILLDLQQKINQRISSILKIPIDDRFVPHITIAKKRKNQEPLQIKKEAFESIVFPVAAFSLFKINPKQMPKYEETARFPLANNI